MGSDFDSLCFVFSFVGVINSRTKGPTVNHAMVGCAKATIAVQGACHHHSTGETTIADPSQVILDGMDLAFKTHTDDSIDDFSHSYISPLKYLTFGSLLLFFLVYLCSKVSEWVGTIKLRWHRLFNVFRILLEIGCISIALQGRLDWRIQLPF